MEGTLVIQSLRVDVDSGSRLVLSSYWVRDGIFAMVWPFLRGCWLRILGPRGLGLWPMDVGSGTRSVQGVLMIDSGWVRSRV